MSTKVLTSFDLGWYELLKLRFQNLADPPSSPEAGWAYWDTDEDALGVYTGSAWVYLGASGTTNLSYTASPTNGVVASDTGTDATLTLADGTDAGLMTPANFTKLAGIEAGATADQTAAEILAALLTVDGAGSGLDADLLDGNSSAFFATATGLSDHLADTADAHDASAISILDTANDFTATDVEGALAELQSDHEADATALSDHIADATAAHAASAISFAPASGIAATDVQTAIVEALTDAQAYADAIAQGLKTHASVKAVALSALDLNGAETIDGYSTSNGDRILVTAQADADDNGIWIVAAGAWTRPVDFDAAGDVVEGAYTLVEEGTIYEGTGWTLSELAGSFGSLTEQTWTQFSGVGEITAGAALTKTGNTLDVAVDGVGIEVNADALRLKDLGVVTAKINDAAVTSAKLASAVAGAGLTGGAGSALAVGAGTGVVVNADDVAVNRTGTNGAHVPLKYSTTVGDGASTSIAVTHSLGTRAVVVQVYDSTTFEDVLVDVVRTSTSVVTLTFAVAPASAAYTAVIFG